MTSQANKGDGFENNQSDNLYPDLSPPDYNNTGHKETGQEPVTTPDNVSEEQKQEWKDELDELLKDEHQTLQLTYTSLEEKFKKSQEEYSELRARLMENKKLEVDRMNQECDQVERPGSITGAITDKALKQKHFKLHEELTDLHRKRGENAQKIIDLTSALKEKEKELQQKDEKLMDALANENSLKAERRHLEQTKVELEATNQLLKDEHQTLQLTYTSLEEKYKKSQEEYSELLARLMENKKLEVDRMNQECDQVESSESASANFSIGEKSICDKSALPDDCSTKALAGSIVNYKNRLKDASQANVISIPKTDEDIKREIGACLELVEYLEREKPSAGVLLDQTKIHHSIDFEIKDEDVIGRGLNGDIVTVIDRRTGVEHALKRVMISWFRGEEILCWVDIRNTGYVPSLYLFRIEYNYIVLQMEKLQNAITLRSVIDDHMSSIYKQDSSLIKPFALYVLLGVLDAVTALHDKEWAHHDLHAGNLMLQVIGNLLKIKVLDFGLAERLDPEGFLKDFGEVVRIFSAVYTGVEFDDVRDARDNWRKKLNEFACLTEEERQELFSLIDGALKLVHRDEVQQYRSLVEKHYNDALTAMKKEEGEIMRSVADKLFPQQEQDKPKINVSDLVVPDQGNGDQSLGDSAFSRTEDMQDTHFLHFDGRVNPQVQAVKTSKTTMENYLSYEEGDILTLMEKPDVMLYGQNIRTGRCGWFPLSDTQQAKSEKMNQLLSLSHGDLQQPDICSSRGQPIQPQQGYHSNTPSASQTPPPFLPPPALPPVPAPSVPAPKPSGTGAPLPPPPPPPPPLSTSSRPQHAPPGLPSVNRSVSKVSPVRQSQPPVENSRKMDNSGIEEDVNYKKNPMFSSVSLRRTNTNDRSAPKI